MKFTDLMRYTPTTTLAVDYDNVHLDEASDIASAPAEIVYRKSSQVCGAAMMITPIRVEFDKKALDNSCNRIEFLNVAFSGKTDDVNVVCIGGLDDINDDDFVIGINSQKALEEVGADSEIGRWIIETESHLYGLSLDVVNKLYRNAW